MAGLILKLRPHEQLMINGVLVENGDRKTKIRVCTEDAHILRMRDAMRPEDAKTPLTRAYFAAQTAVTGELGAAKAKILIAQSLAEYCSAAGDGFRQRILDHANAGEFYKAMRLMREAPEPVLPGARQPQEQPRHANAVSA